MPLLKKMTALTIATLLVGSLAACTKNYNAKYNYYPERAQSKYL